MDSNVNQQKQEENKPERDEKGRLLPGNTANPNGRPKGKTIKERVREWLEEHPDDMQAFVEHFVKENKELAWQMMEGRPSQQTDITTAGESIQPILVKFLDGKTDDNRDSEGVQEAL